jgi:hypothetical protein
MTIQFAMLVVIILVDIFAILIIVIVMSVETVTIIVSILDGIRSAIQ